MDNRAYSQYPMMPTVNTYLSPDTYTGNVGHYYPSSSSQLSYSYPSSPQSVSSMPTNFTLFSCSERTLAKERRRQQNRASQRAYRKRKDAGVKGLHDSIRELHEGAETLKVENGGLKDRNSTLQAELERLLAENQDLKRKRSMSQYSSSKSSLSRRSSCTRCRDASLLSDRKGSPACSHCAPTDTSCISPMSPLDDSINPASPLIVSPQEGLPSTVEADLDGGLLRSFWLDFDDEMQNTLDSVPNTQGGLQGFNFPTLSDAQTFYFSQDPNPSVSEQLSPTITQTIQQAPPSRPSFSEGMSSTNFEPFLGQAEPPQALPADHDYIQSGMLTVNTEVGVITGPPHTDSRGRRNKAPRQPQLL